MDGGFIANETYESVSRNFIESNEPTNDMGVIEEYEGEYSSLFLIKAMQLNAL